MPKLSYSKIVELVKTPAFFESFRLNYGSFEKAGKQLRVPPNVLKELASAKRGYEASDARVKQVQKAIRRMSAGKYETASRFIYARGGMTPAQLDYAKRYAAKSETGQRYFRKAVNEYYIGKTKRVLMPAIGPGGKIINSPKVQRKKRGRKRAIRRRRR